MHNIFILTLAFFLGSPYMKAFAETVNHHPSTPVVRSNRPTKPKSPTKKPPTKPLIKNPPLRVDMIRDGKKVGSISFD